MGPGGRRRASFAQAAGSETDDAATSAREAAAAAAPKVVDVISAEIAHTLDTRGTLLSLISAETHGLTRMVQQDNLIPSYLYPRDFFAAYDLSSDALRALERADVSDLQSRLALLRLDSAEKDTALARARSELEEMLRQFHNVVMQDEQDDGSKGTKMARTHQQPAADKATLGGRQQRPSVSQPRDAARAADWARWSGNLDMPSDGVDHLIRPDGRGTDFSKANKSALQLLSIPFKVCQAHVNLSIPFKCRIYWNDKL